MRELAAAANENFIRSEADIRSEQLDRKKLEARVFRQAEIGDVRAAQGEIHCSMEEFVVQQRLQLLLLLLQGRIRDNLQPSLRQTTASFGQRPRSHPRL